MINNTMIDVTEQIIPEDTTYFNDDESFELYQTCIHLMEEFIKENPTIITEPDFEDIFDENIEELMHSHFDFDIFYTDDSEDEIRTGSIEFDEIKNFGYDFLDDITNSNYNY
jgi:hypothetical protein